MTKSLVLMLTVGLAMVLCGCGAEQPAPDTAEPAATEPAATEPEVTEPEVFEPETIEPEVPQPELTVPEAIEPEVAEPELTEPKVAEPEITQPEVAQPEVTEPDATEPEVTQPEVTEPETTEPEATIESGTTTLELIEPKVAEPETATPETADTSTPGKQSIRAGDASTVAFAVAWSTDADPAAAAKTATEQALQALGCPAKGLVFYEYFPKTIKDEQGDDKEVPDVEKEKAVLPAIRVAAAAVPIRVGAASVPTIGCRARSLVNGGTMLTDTVAVLAIGGEALSCKAVKAKLDVDRKAVGTSIGEQLEDVAELKLVFALSEMNLSFDTTEGVSVEDFIRGVVDAAGKDVTLFGGNCMPNDYETDKGGIQYLDGEVLSGSVVALGIGGPIAVHANHTNEFSPSEQTFEVTKAEDKWIYEFDGKPASEVYRTIRGMPPDEEFTEDWQHPIGVVVTEDKVYLRMVLEEDAEKKARRFVAAVPVGTQVKILAGGADPQAILNAAKEGITESLEKAGESKPLLALLSNCCARGMRLREFRQAEECEIDLAILPVMDEKGTRFPIFGFYAWGELGPIAGPFGGLSCMYQQHTFVSVVLTEEKSE